MSGIDITSFYGFIFLINKAIFYFKVYLT